MVSRAPSKMNVSRKVWTNRNRCLMYVLKCFQAALLESEQLVVVQLLLLLGLLQTSSPEPPLPLLRIQREHHHQAGLEQVAGPAVDLWPPRRKVADRTADRRGDGVGSRAVPEPGGRRTADGWLKGDWSLEGQIDGPAPGLWDVCILAAQVTSARCGAVLTPLSLPVNDYRCLHGLLMDCLHCDVVAQGVKGPSDEGRLSIKEGP